MSKNLDKLFAPYPIHLSVAKLAEVLGVTQKTAYEYVQAGDLPAYRIGTRWLILRDEVKDFLEASSRFTGSLSRSAVDSLASAEASYADEREIISSVA